MKFKTELTTFQRNEALVLTDNSDKFAEWPKVTKERKHEVIHKIRDIKITERAKKSTALTTDPVTRQTSRAPLVQQRVAILRNSTSSSTAKATAAAQIPLLESTNNDFSNINDEAHFERRKCLERESSNDNVAMMALLQQAEGLLSEVNAVRSRTTPRSFFQSGGMLDQRLLHPRILGDQIIAQEGLDQMFARDSAINFVDNSSVGFGTSYNMLSSFKELIGRDHLDFRGDDGSFRSDGLENGQSNKYAVGVEMTSRNIPTSTLTQLDWLLRGLPEAYDDADFDDMKEGPLDDLAVQKLIKEGGRPPSQLAFPSLYSMSQKIMDKLQSAKCLSITLNHMFVYSGRYGVRRHCSRLLIRPPRGCFIPENEPEAVILDLPELLGRNLREVKQFAETSVKGKISNASNSGGINVKGARNANYIPEGGSGKPSKRRAATGVGPDAFFVGGIDLQRTVLFPLDAITDRTLQSWLSGDGEGCIRVELLGHITPPFSGLSPSVNNRCSAVFHSDVP